MKEFEIKKLILAELVKIRHEGPTSPDFGICFNLDDVLLYAENSPCDIDDDEDKIEAILEHLFYKWPKFSGNIAYPVPAPDGETEPNDIFYDGGSDRNIWVGPYGVLRYELLDFLISELEKDFA